MPTGNKYTQWLASSQFFPSLLFILFGILNILFAEKLPANEGLGWDGSRYAAIAHDLLKSQVLDSYLVMRIFPCSLIHVLFKVFSIAFDSKNIILGFEIMNLICLATGIYYVKKIFSVAEIKPMNQFLGFTLLLINFAVLKFNFFYPVMTDAPAFCAAVMLLYFYLSNQTLNLMLISLIGAFTWPVIFYQGLILFVLPKKHSNFSPIPSTWRILISVSSALFAAAIIYLFILSKHADTSMAFTLKISTALLPFTLIAILVWYFFLPEALFNKSFFSKETIQSLFSTRALIAFILFFFVSYFQQQLNISQKVSTYYTLENFLINPLTYALVRPLITAIAHTTYFGCGIILILIFWKRVSHTIASFGLGITLAVLLNLYLIGILTESRTIINLFPWMIIFLMLAINSFSFPRDFYVLILILNFFVSKIWLRIGYDLSSGLDEFGTIAFPNQKFFMNIGPWITDQMWMIQGILFILIFVIILFLVYKIQMKKMKFSLIPRYPELKN